MVAATTKKAENTFTVFRRQVIQTGSYEPAEASCSVTIAVDAEMSQEQIAEQIAEWGATLVPEVRLVEPSTRYGET